MSSLIADCSHSLPLVDQRTSCLSETYWVSWFITCWSTWWVRWPVSGLITWDQVTWWFSTCPLFLRITCWSYHGIYLWDFQLGTCNTWCHGLRPRQYSSSGLQFLRRFPQFNVRGSGRHVGSLITLAKIDSTLANCECRRRWWGEEGGKGTAWSGFCFGAVHRILIFGTDKEVISLFQ